MIPRKGEGETAPEDRTAAIPSNCEEAKSTLYLEDLLTLRTSNKEGLISCVDSQSFQCQQFWLPEYNISPGQSHRSVSQVRILLHSPVTCSGMGLTRRANSYN